jgi:hypothetical protein
LGFRYQTFGSIWAFALDWRQATTRGGANRDATVDSAAGSLEDIVTLGDPGSEEADAQVCYIVQNTANLLEWIDGVAAALDSYITEAITCEEQRCQELDKLFNSVTG